MYPCPFRARHGGGPVMGAPCLSIYMFPTLPPVAAVPLEVAGTATRDRSIEDTEIGYRPLGHVPLPVQGKTWRGTRYGRPLFKYLYVPHPAACGGSAFGSGGHRHEGSKYRRY